MAAEKADSAHSPEPEIPQGLSDEDRLKEAASAAERAIAAQGMANKLRQTAATFTDPKKREKMLMDAYDKEKEANGNSKKARLLQSGAFQGSLGGAGIGGAVSAGVGTLVGTVVGTVAAIPVTGLGALAGAGVGAIHGPWIKLGDLAKGMKADKKKDGDNDGEQQADEISPDDEDVVPNPEMLRQRADALAQERAKKGPDTGSAANGDDAPKPPKKKPRKLEALCHWNTKSSLHNGELWNRCYRLIQHHSSNIIVSADKHHPDPDPDPGHSTYEHDRRHYAVHSLVLVVNLDLNLDFDLNRNRNFNYNTSGFSTATLHA
ncbi:hypothetical protein P171DRAFT_490046 [Karstenula rhodostoma CBS 690.94]|uniref:Uncharacterized protein n=1 Tax=Karstenula rhodostoma CBS 690.94 TaxID=1392251 RepID=A0A9P4P9X9_9PLEO|nr:hypothetical protein P171DRAFT_490046 [Karstenula rhodostoma CBS 690.94]